MTDTPKFDKLVAKYIKAGHNVVVKNDKLGKGSVYSISRVATVGNRCLATVTVLGTVECLNHNTSFKITD